jgi:hypothetical protein
MRRADFAHSRRPSTADRALDDHPAPPHDRGLDEILMEIMRNGMPTAKAGGNACELDAI